MLQLQISFALLCFEANTTVLLDVQTRVLVFKAWPRTDDSREVDICKQLNGDMYKLSVQTGTYLYVLDQLQTYDFTKTIEIQVTCTDAVTNCAAAFKAKSAIYNMIYQDAKQTITEAASNLRRLDFNRKACIGSPALLYSQNETIAPGVISNGFQLSGIPKYCKYPLDTAAIVAANVTATKKAIFSLYAFPNLTFSTTTFSLTTTDLLQYTKQNCVYQSTPANIAWCNGMVKTLASQSFGYTNMQYYVPAKVPNRDGTITRTTNYSSVYQSNLVKSALQASFDCYSSQNIQIYANTMLLTNILNPSAVNCILPMKDFVGITYDKMITRISFQQNEDFRIGQVFTLDFVTQSQMLNTSQEWLSCSASTNETYCNEVLSKSSIISKYYLNAQQLFYSSDNITKIIPISPTMQMSCQSDATVKVMDTQACVSITNVCQNNITTSKTQQFTYSFGNQGSYSENILNISTNAIFPNSENKYCVNYDFSADQISILTNEKTDSPTSGVLTIGSIKIPIAKAVDASTILPVQKIWLLIVGISGFTIILVGFSFWKPWV
ncbi:Conserved_hypothetical protein [Hexamita inflata]|uniref:Transmembrane protein n=1 Tax=Hexamita inflata TaxID=28002 RepID=A0AA86P267_9EUKA|nr:Conserved hypothetical protein [Hexamita inflata]